MTRAAAYLSVAVLVIAAQSGHLTSLGRLSAVRAATALEESQPRDGADRLPTLSTNGLLRLDRELQAFVDEERIAGAVALILRDGQLIYERAFGWSDKEAQRRMTPDTIFRIASQTKAVTSAAVLSLVEEGRIGLDDPVSRFVESFSAARVAVRSADGVDFVPARRAITIRDLLGHTAGLSYGTQREVASLYEAEGLGPAAGFGWYTADKDQPICETMERLGTLPLTAQPGEAWIYGYNTDVLGCVVERASDLPLDEFVRVRITNPLRMDDTSFYLPEEKRERLAAVYTRGDDGHLMRAPTGSKGQGHYVEGPRRSFSGGAGLMSTARDYARFLQMILDGGVLNGVRVLAPETVRLMTTNQIGALHPREGMGFGLGFETTDRAGANGLDPPGAFGWGGAYGTVYRVNPAARIVMLLMIQLLPDNSNVRDVFLSLVHEAMVQPR
jgi:CubicO group peptidase (beta-lactamase class C family)